MLVAPCSVRIPAGGAVLEGDFERPAGARGIVLFAHGSGSGRHSPRNRRVAQSLLQAGYATLLFDLLTREEDAEDGDGRHRFDIPALAARLLAATDWILARPDARDLPLAYFGASTGAGAALVAAADRPKDVRAVVSRGGRPDLAGHALPRVQAPTLLIVGGDDDAVIRLNEQALERLRAPRQLAIVPGAGHLFVEPGTLDEVITLACDWLARHLPLNS